MITHRQALEAAKTLSEYCDTRESCNDGDCIFCDVQDVCLAYSISDRQMRIITKETERLERKEQDNDSVQGELTTFCSQLSNLVKGTRSCEVNARWKMSEEKLKSCPFCGKEPVYVADGKVICICGAMIKSFNDWKPFTNQEAVDKWNRRYKEQDDENTD